MALFTHFSTRWPAKRGWITKKARQFSYENDEPLRPAMACISIFSHIMIIEEILDIQFSGKSSVLPSQKESPFPL